MAAEILCVGSARASESDRDYHTEYYAQKEGRVLLEYQIMSSLSDVAHDGVLCTFSNRSAPCRSKLCGPIGQAAWTVQHIQNHTLLGHYPSATVVRRAAVLAQPSSLRRHWLHYQRVSRTCQA
jgi:hypothetical protein